jgi:hypothetical protein
MLTSTSGADFDDPVYGVKEEDKSTEKVLNKLKIIGITTADCVLVGGKRRDFPFSNKSPSK